jgi:hypothetical protein
MNFNLEHYQKYLIAVGHNRQNGMFRGTQHSNGKYCFATQQKLGEDGEIDKHPMLGKRVIHIESENIYRIDKVGIQWMKGFYYYLTLKCKGNTQITEVFNNINSNDENILQCIDSFHQKYIFLH